MSRQQRPNESPNSPLSLLVHAAGYQNHPVTTSSNGAATIQSGKEDTNTSGQSYSQSFVPQASFLLQNQQQQQQQQVFPLLGGSVWFQDHAALAAQQQQQAVAMGLATDLRTAVAAAQLQQAAHFQTQDLLMMIAAQQLGLQGSMALENLQERDIMQRQQEMEELQRRHMLLSMNQQGQATNDVPTQQGETQLRQDQLKQDSTLDRSELCAPASNNSVESVSELAPTTKNNCTNPPGSIVVPCRARGMPMDHNFEVSLRYLLCTLQFLCIPHLHVFL